ncbi:MAG: hypothetical protein JNM70_21680 [Anaerolineae bacterium]|nr:hypothetical protein [Anaerolineae bacterium]
MHAFKLALLLVFLIPTFLVHAQEGGCEIDIDAAVSLLEQARARASDSDADGARSLLAQAAAEIEALLQSCPGDIHISAEKTLTLGGEGSPAGQLSFKYPEGWLTAEEQNDFPNILIGSNASALAKPLDGALPPPFAAGEVLIAVGLASTSTMGGEAELGLSPTPLSFINYLITPVEDAFGKASQSTARTINDRPAAWASFTSTNQFNLLLMIVDMQRKTPDGQSQYVLMLALTAPGELATIEPTLLAMAETFRLSLN